MSEIKTDQQLEQEVNEKVREMARLTMLSGRINPIQEKNLKMYPWIFFEGVKEASIKYDFTSASVVDAKEDKENFEIKYNIKEIDKNNLIVCYKLTLDETDNNLLEKRFKAIEKAVRDLFWKEVSVEIYFNDSIVYGNKK